MGPVTIVRTYQAPVGKTCGRTLNYMKNQQRRNNIAITKRVRVAFDAKFVASTADVEYFTEQLLSYSKRFLDGDKTLAGDELELARAAAEGGVENAVELSIKMSYAKAIKHEMSDDQVTVSNVKIAVVK